MPVHRSLEITQSVLEKDLLSLLSYNYYSAYHKYLKDRLV